MRPLLIFALAAVLTAPIGCTPASRTGSVLGKAAPACVRKTVGFYQIPAELARVQNCGGVALCQGALTNFETKQVAGWMTNSYIWGINDTSTTFDAPTQDGFLADARARAQAARPGSKSIVSISFFTDIVVANPSPSYGYIGAVVEYADCGFSPPQE